MMETNKNLGNHYLSNPTVAVTNACGFTESWIVYYLLQNGIHVKAIVPTFVDEKEILCLKTLSNSTTGHLEIITLNPFHSASYAEVLQGCEVIFQSNPDFPSFFDDAFADIIQSSLACTRILLKQVNKVESIKRVVYTSSVEAIYGSAKELEQYPEKKGTEEHWNTTSNHDDAPLAYAKTMCEKEAWRINAKQNRWDLVVINQATVVGPSICSIVRTKAATIINELREESVRSEIPQIEIPFVDVRDVAKAHLSAAFSTDAQGRYILVGQKLRLKEIAEVVNQAERLHTPLTIKEVSSFMFPFVSSWGSFTKKQLKCNNGYAVCLDNMKAKTNLGIQFRNVETSLKEFLQCMN